MLIFVYGTLKRGFGNHRVLGGAPYVGKAVTLLPMQMVGYGVPFVWPDERGKQAQGEVYDIGDPATDIEARKRLAGLDRLESNGHVYQRRMHAVQLIEDARGIRPMPRNAGDIVTAWVYEAMDHIQEGRASHIDEERNVNADGHYEWEWQRQAQRAAE